MAIMVGLSAILGSLAMGMLFDSGHIPEDLMRNGASKLSKFLENTGELECLSDYLCFDRHDWTNRSPGLFD